MKIPQGYVGPGQPISPIQGEIPETRVLKLKKSLYGLKQAPGSSNLTHRSFSVFRLHPADYSPFTRHQGSCFVAILIYVDDFRIAGNNQQEIENLKGLLSKH